MDANKLCEFAQYFQKECMEANVNSACYTAAGLPETPEESHMFVCILVCFSSESRNAAIKGAMERGLNTLSLNSQAN